MDSDPRDPQSGGVLESSTVGHTCPPAGWYRDPLAAGARWARWWDGSTWTGWVWSDIESRAKGYSKNWPGIAAGIFALHAALIVIVTMVGYPEGDPNAELAWVGDPHDAWSLVLAATPFVLVLGALGTRSKYSPSTRVVSSLLGGLALLMGLAGSIAGLADLG